MKRDNKVINIILLFAMFGGLYSGIFPVTGRSSNMNIGNSINSSQIPRTDFSQFNVSKSDSEGRVESNVNLTCEIEKNGNEWQLLFRLECELIPLVEESSGKKLTHLIIYVAVFNGYKMDIGYFVMEDIDNMADRTLISKNITMNTDYSPDGMSWEFERRFDYLDEIANNAFYQSNYVKTPAVFQYHDGDAIRVRDFSNYTYETRHHFETFEVDIQHRGKGEIYFEQATNSTHFNLENNVSMSSHNLTVDDPLEAVRLRDIYLSGRDNSFSKSSMNVLNLNASELYGNSIQDFQTNSSDFVQYPNWTGLDNPYTYGFGHGIVFEYLEHFEIRMEFEIQLIEESDENEEENEDDANIAGFVMEIYLLMSGISIGIILLRKKKNKRLTV